MTRCLMARRCCLFSFALPAVERLPATAAADDGLEKIAIS